LDTDEGINALIDELTGDKFCGNFGQMDKTLCIEMVNDFVPRAVPVLAEAMEDEAEIICKSIE
jgi:hypothetical protein